MIAISYGRAGTRELVLRTSCAARFLLASRRMCSARQMPRVIVMVDRKVSPGLLAEFILTGGDG